MWSGGPRKWPHAMQVGETRKGNLANVTHKQREKQRFSYRHNNKTKSDGKKSNAGKPKFPYAYRYQLMNECTGRIHENVHANEQQTCFHSAAFVSC